MSSFLGLPRLHRTLLHFADFILILSMGILRPMLIYTALEIYIYICKYLCNVRYVNNLHYLHKIFIMYKDKNETHYIYIDFGGGFVSNISYILCIHAIYVYICSYSLIYVYVTCRYNTCDMYIRFVVNPVPQKKLRTSHGKLGPLPPLQKVTCFPNRPNTALPEGPWKGKYGLPELKHGGLFYKFDACWVMPGRERNEDEHEDEDDEEEEDKE